jgi:hypothetical protein
MERLTGKGRLSAVTLEPAPDGSSAPTQAPGMVGKL